ncbi:MAG: outer membrane lipoprotein carrier protein LolA [Legionellales bacterium RIFCSPHIGHO2_12_FULL_35_11]|nr:MAG: outer membrane lipoprotein carrier protein LolA [Legionellales bacterium RIFCSPHIGHO2_12_FULL_35_11]
MIFRFFILFIFTFSAFADISSDILQRKLEAIKTLQATFTQVISAKKQNSNETSGEMALARPNHFRWQTKKPMPQLLVADGQKLWLYDEELEQVSVKKQSKKIGGAVAIFLGDDKNIISKDFNVVMLHKNNKDYFTLLAKSPEASFEKVQLVFTGDLINGIDLFDQLGQHTKVTLDKVAINQKLSSALFKFIVPKGTDVVTQ